MIAVIKGDIIHSRKMKSPEVWLIPLKNLLSNWGTSPKSWELAWGDSFQLEIEDPSKALEKAIAIKALIKGITEIDADEKQSGLIDVRMSIGIGKKTFSAERVSESNGEAFIFSGEKFDKLKKEKTTLAVQSASTDFDDIINLYLKLATLFMDRWTISSAELIRLVLQNPDDTQVDIGKKLGIKQNSVSGRWRRAYVEEMRQVNIMYKTLLKKYLL